MQYILEGTREPSENTEQNTFEFLGIYECQQDLLNDLENLKLWQFTELRIKPVSK